MDPSPDLPPINDPAAYIPQPPPTYLPQPPSALPTAYIPQPPYNVAYIPQPPATVPATQVFPPVTPEPAAHIVHAAYPAASNHVLPPYAEMITAAIAALKEKDGSSRQAIAKYIESQYSNLPSTHSNLLTQTLKRLKNSGQLVMIKHSYALPTSAPVPLSLPLPSPPPPPPPPGPYTTTGPTTSVNNPSGSKRGPGRPPKVKPDVQPNGGLQPVSIAPVSFEPVSIESVTIEPVSIEQESMLVSLGLVDEGPKRGRGRGRPPKSITVSPPVVVPESSGKRGRGRPPRPKSLSVVKRGRGRPPRTGAVSAVGIENGRRPRGRPKRSALSGVSSAGRPRGRPPKNVAIHGGAGGVLPAKRPGRPPKAGGAKKTRKLSGRPLGRPKKDASGAAIQASLTQQEVAYQELKFKLEHFQTRIKHTISVVKPYFNTEVAVSAVGGALRELEELATMDLSAPANVQSQEPPLLQN